MAGIFISYRREDSAAWAGRIYERLAREFGANQLFMDVDTVAPGMDFVQAIEERVASSDVVLAVIGKQWIAAKDSKGARRLDDPRDFVRLELEAGMKRNIRIIPVLVDGAQIPTDKLLPEALGRLTRRNAVEVRHTQFSSDLKSLVDFLLPLVPFRGPDNFGNEIGPHEFVLLYLSNGGTCRCAMANVLTRYYLSSTKSQEAVERGPSELRPISAGLHAATASEPFMSHGAQNALRNKLGVNCEGHRTLRAVRGLLQRADLILAMDRKLLAAIREDHCGKSKLFTDHLGRAGFFGGAQIRDPIGGSPREYARCFRILDKIICGNIGRFSAMQRPAAEPITSMPR